MPQQPLDEVSPDGIAPSVRERGSREPNCPQSDDKKMTRLRTLLWSGAWSDQDISLIAWSEDRGCWYMWRAQ